MFIHRAYERALRMIKAGKISLMVLAVLLGIEIFITAFLWADDPHTITIWSEIVPLISLIQGVICAILFWGFPHKFLSVPLSKYAIPDGEIEELYNKYILALKSPAKDFLLMSKPDFNTAPNWGVPKLIFFLIK